MSVKNFKAIDVILFSINAQQLRQILNSYSRFCSNYAVVAWYEFLKRNLSWRWASTHQNSFNDLKYQSHKFLVSEHPNFNKRFTLKVVVVSTA